MGTPANSGKHAIIASCNWCAVPCTYQMRFSFADANSICVQRRGEHKQDESADGFACGDGRAVKRRKVDIARRYA
eukprot:5935995-Lingulodinium_polyedra.AAC.1